MRIRGTIAAVAIVALLGLLLIVNNVGARTPMGPPGPGNLSIASAVAPLLQYQGQLTDPTTGEPVTDGNHTMTFRLYDDQAGTTELWEETKDVAVQNGVFSTALGDEDPLDQGLFDGRELWLGVKVGGDSEATPLQQVLPVAYAMSLVPGAHISATSSSVVLTVSNAGTGDALQVNGDLSVSGSLTGGSHEHSGGDITSGTVNEPRIDEEITRDNEIMPTVLDNDGAGSGLDADRLDGQDASAFASNAHDHYGESWSGSGTGLTLQSADSYGLRAESTSTAAGNAAVFGSIGETSGYPSREVGVRGEAADGYGVAGGSSTSSGVYGFSDTSHGVWGTTGASNASAVLGQNTSSGDGVLGSSASGHGVVGDGGSGSSHYGGYFTGGAGVYAEGSGDTGVLGKCTASTGQGVRGELGDTWAELASRTQLPPPFNLTYAYGVYGVGSGANLDYGGYFRGDNYGVYGVSTDDEGNNYGIYTPDNLYVGGKIDLVGLVDPVIGERFEVHPDGEYEVGDLLVIDPDSPYLILSTEANDTKVIGVVGPTVDYKDGELMVIVMGYHGAKPEDAAPPSGPGEDGGSTDDESPSRTVARIKVDASYGAIKRGDLLTTSPTPGHAMKAEPVDVGGVAIHRPGTIIGKALEALDAGQGLIEVFISLQ